MVLLLGIAYLAHAYHIGATPPGTSAYQSVLSQLIAAVAGRGIFYWVSIASILLVLCLSANTSFADFPRLCRAVAEDGYLPRSFANQGRRLVYSEGIWLLAGLSAVLLLVFDGVTDRLIPLFAVGAFLAFTLSQSGMVAHWWKRHAGGALAAMAVNGVGALATGLTVLIVAVVKFVAGAFQNDPCQYWLRQWNRVLNRSIAGQRYGSVFYEGALERGAILQLRFGNDLRRETVSHLFGQNFSLLFRPFRRLIRDKNCC